MLKEQKLNILLVEDDDVDVMAFRRSMKKNGAEFHLTVFDNAKEALGHLNDNLNEPDCIFIDYQLPDSDGLALLKEIKKLNTDIPVAAMTSQGDEFIAVEMMKSGAFDYFPKSELSAQKLGKTIHSMQNFLRIERERKHAKKQLEENERFIKKITESSPSFIYVFDIKENKFVYVNPEVEAILGHSAEEMLLWDSEILSGFIHPDDWMLYPQKIERYKSLEGILESEYRIKNADGKYIWLLCRDVVFLRSEDGVSQILGTAVDVSNRKKIENDLIEARKKAEDLARSKSEFLSNMSHEIRTPMNAIIGLTDILLHENLDSNVIDNLESIKHSADNLLVIINDILDFSKIEAGKISFETIDFDIRNLLFQIKKTLGYKLAEKALDLIIDIDESVPQILIGDPFRLNQIILNLTGNAVKFTKEGEIRISARQIEINNANVTIQVDVIDSGIGIPEERIEKIFESFTQVSDDTSRKFGGTGLGLTITKRLVNLQGGKINVKSKLGKGSVFSVQIPYLLSEKKSISKKKTSDSYDINLSGASIMVFEDNPMNQVVIKQILKKWHCDFLIFENGKEGLEYSGNKQFDLVLMDLQMPVLDGMKTAALIRDGKSDKLAADIPIIALTADAFSETRNKVLEAGMNDMVTKPFDKQELFSKIVKLIQDK